MDVGVHFDENRVEATMRAKRLGKTQNSHELNDLIRPLRDLDNYTNAGWLILEYLTLFLILAPTIWVCEQPWDWYFKAPLVLVAIALVGGVQHRLAGLAHEASHYAMFKNRLANDLVSDLFCMYPIFATTHQYRLVHIAHHQYTNDWERDPDLLNIGRSKLMHLFPMTRWQFICNYFVRFFWPPVLLRYLWDIVYLSAFGKGINPYTNNQDALKPNELTLKFRYASVLGVVYFFGLVAALATFNNMRMTDWVLWTPPVALSVALVITWILPEAAFFQSPLKQIYSSRTTGMLRLVCYTTLLTTFAYLRLATGRNWGNYFLLLWALPMLTSFAYYMVLRDVYQHANADDGKLTNTRVFFCDPFTWWAIFVYGQDMHVPHHMYPAVPHYNLLKLHRLLQDKNDEYARHVVECHGLFANHVGKPTIAEVMERPTTEVAQDVVLEVEPPLPCDEESSGPSAVASSPERAR